MAGESQTPRLQHLPGLGEAIGAGAEESEEAEVAEDLELLARRRQANSLSLEQHTQRLAQGTECAAPNDKTKDAALKGRRYERQGKPKARMAP
jgi:hypothetical protein